MALDEEFAFYTECQLATLEGLKMRKSSGKHEVMRQQDIADQMVEVCRRYQIKPSGLPRRGTPRLSALLRT
jgi:hypothetical protein